MISILKAPFEDLRHPRSSDHILWIIPSNSDVVCHLGKVFVAIIQTLFDGVDLSERVEIDMK